MSSLVHCIYTSCQAHPMSHRDVDDLIKKSRENNLKHGITGILFSAGGCFLQVLEGEAEYIDELYGKILLEPRHTRITRIVLEAIPHRYFGEWTMGLSMLSSEELVQIIEGGQREDREAILSSIDEGRAKKLLRAFSDGRWRQTIARNPESAVA